MREYERSGLPAEVLGFGSGKSRRGAWPSMRSSAVSAAKSSRKSAAGPCRDRTFLVCVQFLPASRCNGMVVIPEWITPWRAA
jgi:hypothetical protein